MPKTPFNFIARFQAKAGRADDLRAALEAMIEPTRAEPGCVNYDLHQYRDDPTRFVLYEGWQGEEALAEHMKLPHFLALTEQIGELAEQGPDGKPFQAEAVIMVSERAR